jgi:hypothetical protein
VIASVSAARIDESRGAELLISDEPTTNVVTLKGESRKRLCASLNRGEGGIARQ